MNFIRKTLEINVFYLLKFSTFSFSSAWRGYGESPLVVSVLWSSICSVDASHDVYMFFSHTGHVIVSGHMIILCSIQHMTHLVTGLVPGQVLDHVTG
jgi:hypothetical protein